MSAPVYGLVLAGGKSLRMHTDKAALSYHGRSQLTEAMRLVTALVQRAFVSVRADQVDDPLRAGFAQIIDREVNMGPIAGIMAAQAQFPDVAWLVVACDLPFLDARTLEHLLAARDAARAATAYVSNHDGLPEPLCAIYEPASGEALEAYLREGRQCPRKFLLKGDVHLIAARHMPLDHLGLGQSLTEVWQHECPGLGGCRGGDVHASPPLLALVRKRVSGSSPHCSRAIASRTRSTPGR